jgi:hypothetical protein
MCRGGKGRKLDCSEWNPRVELVGVEWSPYRFWAQPGQSTTCWPSTTVRSTVVDMFCISRLQMDIKSSDIIRYLGAS